MTRVQPYHLNLMMSNKQMTRMTHPRLISKFSINIYSAFIILDIISVFYCDKITMKGLNKKKKGLFKKGNKGGPGRRRVIKVEREYVRPTLEEAELLDEDSVVHDAMVSALPQPDIKTDVMMLRPRRKQPNYKSSGIENHKDFDSDFDCYKIVHMQKLFEMFHQAYSEHNKSHPKCRGMLTFDRKSEERRGLVWRERAICRNCSFLSHMHSLYTEVPAIKGKKGRKKATANVGVNIALTQTPIGGSSLVRLLAGGNIEGPSCRGINKMSKTCNDVIVRENKSDMSQRLQQLKKINRWQGRPENIIPVQIDGVYNNSLYSGVGKNPFQPATQCTVTVAENITPRKQIIATETVNKLCSKHGFHTQNDSNECDIQCAPCSSTASMEMNIGDEQRWAERCFRQLKSEGMEAKYVTTDGDGKSFEASRQLYERGETNTAPIHQLDTRHLSANHRKYVKSSGKVNAIMPGRTKAYRLFLQNKFALDIAQRCHAELQCIIKKYRASTTSILNRSRDIMSTIKQCYAGNHSLCKVYSAVCNGEKHDNWFNRSVYLQKTFKIDIKKEESERTLMDVIEYRLGDETVQLTRLNSNTQKVEGTNRAIKRSLPKDKTFSRNYESRAHSALHSVNNGPGNSLRKLCCAAGCPIPSGSGADLQLQYLQISSENKRRREKSMIFKIKRRLRRHKLFKLYEEHREKKNYVKNQLTKHLAKKKSAAGSADLPGPSFSSDHSAYARKPVSIGRKRKSKQTGRLMPETFPSNDTLVPPRIQIVRLNGKMSYINTFLIMTNVAYIKVITIIVNHRKLRFNLKHHYKSLYS